MEQTIPRCQAQLSFDLESLLKISSSSSQVEGSDIIGRSSFCLQERQTLVNSEERASGCYNLGGNVCEICVLFLHCRVTV